MPKRLLVMNGSRQSQPSLLERIDVALASRLVRAVGEPEPALTAQEMLDGLRAAAPSDASFLASLLRLRGFVLTDEDALAVLRNEVGRLAAVSQEYRMLRGLEKGLAAIRQRARDGVPPDGWFLLELFRMMTQELPRFRNNELRRGPPWDAVLYTSYPSPDQLHFLLDTFDAAHHYRDQPMLFGALHPVRQGFRILWRFARIAPFPDFNGVMAWLGMNAWLQVKGYPLLSAEPLDQAFVAKLIGGPPPSKIVQFEARLLTALEQFAA